MSVSPPGSLPGSIAGGGLSLEDIESLIAERKLPPVGLWDPEREASMDMVIRRDGSWWYQGSVIQRERMVRLFSTILRREKDGRFCLVTPVEKLFITVEDAPFAAIAMKIFDAPETGSTVVFETSVGDQVVLDQLHSLYLEQDSSGHPKPYLEVRDGLRALLTRSVYYELVDNCVEYNGEIGVMSRNQFHVLDNVPGESTDAETLGPV